jgi:hypothetical protein
MTRKIADAIAIVVPSPSAMSGGRQLLGNGNMGRMILESPYSG